MDLRDSDRLVPSGEVVIREVNGEALLLHQGTEELFEFDPVSTRFWHVLTSSDSVGDAVSVLQSGYDVDNERLLADVQQFAAQLVQLDLAVVVT